MASDNKVEVKTAVAPKIEHGEEETRVQMTNAEMAKMISNAVAEALKIAIPAAAVGINQATAAATAKDRERITRDVMKKVQRCPICLLPLSACGGPYKTDSEGNEIKKTNEQGNPVYSPEVNHIKYFCGPKEESLYKWFQGVYINGVRFLADYQGHVQWIPKKCDIPTMISAWEKNEKELSQKRQAEGNGAGRLSPGGAIPGNQGALGWR